MKRKGRFYALDGQSSIDLGCNDSGFAELKKKLSLEHEGESSLKYEIRFYALDGQSSVVVGYGDLCPHIPPKKSLRRRLQKGEDDGMVRPKKRKEK